MFIAWSHDKTKDKNMNTFMFISHIPTKPSEAIKQTFLEDEKMLNEYTRFVKPFFQAENFKQKKSWLK